MDKPKGFTLIELMTSVAIIAILLSLALPAFNNHFKRSKFTEVVLASNALQRAVEICYYKHINLAACDSFAKLGRAKADFTTPKNVANIELSNAGAFLITSTASAEASNSGADTYIMQGNIVSGQIQWTLSQASTCITEGTC